MADHRPPLLIDTCALKQTDFLQWLKGYSSAKIMPSVAYMEYCIFMVETKKRPIEYVGGVLRSIGVSVQPFDKSKAEYAAEFMTERTRRRCRECGKMDWNDCMIAAHAPIAPTVLVTENVKDFPYLGGRVMSPRDAMKTYRH